MYPSGEKDFDVSDDGDPVYDEDAHLREVLIGFMKSQIAFWENSEHGDVRVEEYRRQLAILEHRKDVTVREFLESVSGSVKSELHKQRDQGLEVDQERREALTEIEDFVSEYTDLVEKNTLLEEIEQ